ncbi:MAG TPA: hypothetical protein VGD14_21800 [bacterium]
MKIKIAIFVVSTIFLLPHLLPGQYNDRPTKPIFKTTIDDNTKFTTIGNISLTIVNFGTIGDGFVIQSHLDKPFCEYPKGSDIEHLFDGGLWVAGVHDDGTIIAMTGAMDISFLIDIVSSFEFTNSAGADSFQTCFEVRFKNAKD